MSEIKRPVELPGTPNVARIGAIMGSEAGSNGLGVASIGLYGG
jgi:hypothetical protein